MINLREFENSSAYEAYVASDDFVAPNVSYLTSGEEIKYAKDVPSHDYSQDYLTFEVLDNGSISVLIEDVYLSNDNGEHWATEISGLTIGDKVIAKGDCHSFGGGSESAFSFGNMRFNAYGNIMSIYDSEGFRTRTTFDNDSYSSSMSYLFLFAPIVSAEHLILPATTLANTYDCYCAMFQGCSGLTSAPLLPATTLADRCYAGMFGGCSSLTSAPTLPATTLANECYHGMFYDCTSLTSAPTLPATTLADECYEGMFSNCTGLISAPSLPATTLAYLCYNAMFYDCTGLTSAPTLPATTLANYCYQSMFYGCTNLNHIECLATDISASSCTFDWVNGVAASGTFVKPSTTDWSSKTGNHGIPANWTVEDAS